MTVNELIAEISELFPGAFAKPATAEAWRRQFVAALSRFEGARLEAAWTDTMASWTLSGWPKPGHILAHIPAEAPATDGFSGDQASDAIRRIREEGFRKTGMWLPHWGPKPGAEDAKGRPICDMDEGERNAFFATMRRRHPEIGAAMAGRRSDTPRTNPARRGLEPLSALLNIGGHRGHGDEEVVP